MNTINYLIIEEDYSERMLLKEILSLNIITAIEAFNNIDGLKKLEKMKENIDVIMVDLDTSSENDIFTLLLINNISSSYNIPLVVFYSKGTNASIINFLEEHGVEIAEKPIFIETIKPIIERYS